jgi:integrase
LTGSLLFASILKTTPDTRNRKRYCIALAALAKFAGVDLDVKPLIGSYGAKQLTPRDLPDDLAIARWFPLFKDPAWRWAYGAIATFGLRPHEIFHLDTTDLEQGGYTLSVLDDTKKGARRVWACYPEWVDCFELRAPKIPAVTGRNNGELGERCGQYFRRQGLPFRAYDLRHCWAVRTLEFGLDVSLAAQQMGHSVKVHTDTYHRWISDRHHQRAFDLLMMRGDRPKAPILF